MISHCFIHLSSVHSLCFLAVCGGGSAGGPAGNLHITITERWFIIEDARHKGNDISATEKETNKTQARSTLESKAAEARRRSEISSDLTASAEEKVEGKEGRIYISLFSSWKRQEASKGLQEVEIHQCPLAAQLFVCAAPKRIKAHWPPINSSSGERQSCPFFFFKGVYFFISLNSFSWYSCRPPL